MFDAYKGFNWALVPVTGDDTPSSPDSGDDATKKVDPSQDSNEAIAKTVKQLEEQKNALADQLRKMQSNKDREIAQERQRWAEELKSLRESQNKKLLELAPEEHRGALMNQITREELEQLARENRELKAAQEAQQLLGETQSLFQKFGIEPTGSTPDELFNNGMSLLEQEFAKLRKPTETPKEEPKTEPKQEDEGTPLPTVSTVAGTFQSKTSSGEFINQDDLAKQIQNEMGLPTKPTWDQFLVYLRQHPDKVPQNFRFQ